MREVYIKLNFVYVTKYHLLFICRDEGQIQQSIEETVKAFGGIDIVINNASAISLTGTQETSMKTYDLMHTINTR